MNRSGLWLLPFAALVSMAWAQETRLLSDFSVEGDWKVHPWNKAKGTAALSDEFPPSLVTEAGAPRKSLVATIQWPSGKDFAFFNLDPPAMGPIPFKVLSVSLWVKGTGTGHFIELHFRSADDKEVKVGLGAMDFTDWRKLRKEVPAGVKQPLVLKGIVTHNWGLPGGDHVRLFVTRLEAVVDPSQRLIAEGGGPLFAVDTAAPNGLVGDDGRAAVTLRLTSWQPEEKAYEIRYSLTAWNGQKTPGKPVAARVKGAWQQNLDVPCPAFGPVRLDAELWEAGAARPLATASRTLVRLMPVPKLTPEQRLKSPMGVNGHYQSPWGSLGRMGIHWGRDYSWGWLKGGEKAPMAPNGVDFRLTLKAAEEGGVILLPITMRSFWDDAKKAFLEDEAAIAAAFARLGKAFPSLPYWELDNEADLASPNQRLRLANYMPLIRAAAKGLREAGKARVALNGTAGIHYEDTLELLKSPIRDDFAVVNYHYYTGTVPPELATEDVNTGAEGRRESMSFLDQLRRINRAAHAAGKEAWLTEIGWDVTYGPAVGERLQAVYLPRVYLLARWCGTDKVFWFFDRDVKGGTNKFSSSGLIDASDQARPSAAAMAALSAFTADAQPDGSVDLGDDRWCLLFKRPSDGWVAAIWSVMAAHPMPKEAETAEAAYDLFGNKITPKEITPEVTYLELKKLPFVWDAQRHAEWASSTSLRVFPGGKALAQVMTGGGTLSWEGVPKGVALLGDSEGPGRPTAIAITCDPAVPAGSYVIRAVISAQGWRRSWPVTLRIEPPVLAKAQPYEAGQPAAIELRLAADTQQEATIEAPQGTGTVQPATLTLEPGKPQKIEFTAAAAAKGPVPLTLTLANGARQRLPLRPHALDAPFLQQMNYEGLFPWPAAARLSSEHFASTSLDFAPEAWLGWVPQGLTVQASFSVKDLTPGDPKWFWDNTCLELFVDTSPGPHQGWGKASHQFWFTPALKDGKWWLYAGEWKRSDAIAATIYDDKRCKTAIAFANGRLTVKAFIPSEALGAAPAEGAAWRAAIALQRMDLTGKANAAWPVLKEDGLLTGAQNLGIIRFTR